jgi:hypothetical protein
MSPRQDEVTDNPMSQTEPNPRTTRSPGQIALAVIGWFELTISVILFVLEVYVASAVFGVASVFVTFIASQVQRQMIAYRERTGQPTAEGPPRQAGPAQRPGSAGTAFWILLGLGAALLVASAVFVVLRNYGFAANFVLWALTMGLNAQRVSQMRS